MPSIAPRQYSATPPLKLSFLGLGVMGYPMAGHLSAAGHNVTVYNRTASKALAWAEEFGGKYAATPREAAQDADIVMSCVGNDDDLRSVVLGEEGALAGMKPGACYVDHTTASANVARELYAQAKAQSLGFVDAPVSGGQAGAVGGLLTIMCGGDDQHFSQVEPVLAAYGRAVTHLGAAGAGQLCKMVNQICVAGVLQGLSEAIAFGKAAQLDMHQVLEVISKGAAQSWQMEHRGGTMVEGRFDFGFAVDWMRKDLGLVLEEGKRMQASLPVTALIDQFYADVQRQGGNRLDTSSLITRLERHE
ncbi:NAD(P)-dependent oxidoreductase [Pusillimonas sp. CC-YST705]|uniref:NAD(P)-dependent oxidoreductase n=1 Tax=Mesopusillimonas faecipullorum TaxID=2755040 RepID=A0ABS8CBJ1_9BURK|nr:NAD(P)-dependent oxidoreductase [Mesopusillimonas faecipullorum]MCB5363389.1 NAD(P)-dependent oxidoreductase [Mesopusillimonas faecipullorum]